MVPHFLQKTQAESSLSVIEIRRSIITVYNREYSPSNRWGSCEFSTVFCNVLLENIVPKTVGSRRTDTTSLKGEDPYLCARGGKSEYECLPPSKKILCSVVSCDPPLIYMFAIDNRDRDPCDFSIALQV